MLKLDSNFQVYLYSIPVDMRKSFDTLGSLVKGVKQNSFYVFFSRTRNRVKILYWDTDGLALWYKRLEAGTFKLSGANEIEEITGIDLEKLLSGTDFRRIKISKNYK